MSRKHYIAPYISVIDKISIFTEFNQIRIENNLNKFTDTEMVDYINRYCRGEWDYLRSKIIKNKNQHLIDKELSKLSRKKEKIERKQNSINRINFNKTMQEEIESRRSVEKSRPGSKTKIKDGYVYFMINPVYENWTKIGSAINLEDRERTYQTYDPYQNYKIIYSKYCSDRSLAESPLYMIYSKITEEKVNGLRLMSKKPSN